MHSKEFSPSNYSLSKSSIQKIFFQFVCSRNSKSSHSSPSVDTRSQILRLHITVSEWNLTEKKFATRSFEVRPSLQSDFMKYRVLIAFAPSVHNFDCTKWRYTNLVYLIEDNCIFSLVTNFQSIFSLVFFQLNQKCKPFLHELLKRRFIAGLLLWTIQKNKRTNLVCIRRPILSIYTLACFIIQL